MKRSEPLWVCLLLGLFGLALFSRTLGYAMVFDDEIYLVGSPIFKSAENFAAIFTNFEGVATMAARSGLEGDISTNFLMRPLTYLTFHWNFRLDGLNPTGYRLLNIVIHCANAFLVWRLAWLLLEGKRLQSAVAPAARALVPCLSALLFFVHPLQIESVVYIIQRATSLCAFFYLAAIVCHFEANKRPGMGWRVTSVLSVLGAMFCKESAVTAPVVAVLLDVTAFGAGLRQAVWRARWLLLTLPILPLLLTAVSQAQRGGFTGKAVLNIAHSEADSAYAFHYALTQPGVWLRYLGLLVWPEALNIDPDVPPVVKATDFRFWGAILGIGLISGIVVFLRDGPRTRFAGEAAFLGLLWFALTVSPDSSLVPLPDLMAEHRSYLPSVGIFILGAALFCSLPLHPLITTALGLALAGAFSIATFQRCTVWSAPELLWRDVCDKSPGKPRPWLNLGAAYFEAGKVEESEATFLHSIEITPTIPAFANLAFINLTRNLPERAYEFGCMGLKYRPSGYDSLLLLHLGDACVRLKRWQEAINVYREVLALLPARLDIRFRLCDCLMETFNPAGVLEVLHAGASFHPDSPELQAAIAKAEGLQDRFKLRLGP